MARRTKQKAITTTIRQLKEALKELSLSDERKECLYNLIPEISNALVTILPWRSLVYIVEGATDLETDSKYPPTDPDEDIALLVIAFWARRRKESAIIAVPDKANQRHTSAYLRKFGFHPKAIAGKKSMKDGKLTIVAMNNRVEINKAVRLTRKNRHVIVLGPPRGFSVQFIRGAAQVTFMGSVKIKNGTLDKTSLSTSTRSKDSEDFMLSAQNCLNEQVSSSSMCYLGINLLDLDPREKIIAPMKQLWCSNTYGQILGTGPVQLLKKRLRQSNSGRLFVNDREECSDVDFDFKEEDEFAYHVFLEWVQTVKPNIDALLVVVEELGEDYKFLQDGDDTKVRLKLQQIVTAIAKKGDEFSECSYLCNKKVAELGSNHVRCAVAALLLSIKSLYEEKTINGWQKAAHGGECLAEEFVKLYNQGSCKQILYDPYIVLRPCLGLEDIEQIEGASDIADRLLLVLRMILEDSWKRLLSV